MVDKQSLVKHLIPYAPHRVDSRLQRVNNFRRADLNLNFFRMNSSIDLNRDNFSENDSDTVNEESKRLSDEIQLKNAGDGEEQLKLKKRKLAKRFSDDTLIGKDGIERVYAEFPRVSKLRGRGFEVIGYKLITIIFF